MDRKEARKILGVTKETSRNDIERKYSILLKKHRASSMRVEAADEDAAEGNAPVSGSAQPSESALKLAESNPQNISATEEYTFDQITEAYNVLMGYEVKIKEQPPSKMAPLLKKAGIDEKKARNFLYYYKFYILGVLLLAIALFYGIRSFVNRVDPDFNIAFLGSFSYYDAVEKLSDSIKENIPAIKEPGIDGAYLTTADFTDNRQSGDQTSSGNQSANNNNPDSTATQPQTGGKQQTNNLQISGDQQYAMQMKAMVLISAGDIDVFIVDRDRFFQYAKQGVFLSLDDIAPKLGADMDKNKEFITKADNTDPLDTDGNKTSGSGTGSAEGTSDAAIQAHLYGIDVSDSKLLKETGVIGPESIAAIFAGTKRLDKAEEFIKFLMK